MHVWLSLTCTKAKNQEQLYCKQILTTDNNLIIPSCPMKQKCIRHATTHARHVFGSHKRSGMSNNSTCSHCHQTGGYSALHSRLNTQCLIIQKKSKISISTSSGMCSIFLFFFFFLKISSFWPLGQPGSTCPASELSFLLF